jgi:hypothetical protein
MASTLGYLTILGSAALLLGACIIKSTTTTDDDTHTTTTHTTSQGAGGSVPTGGSGGIGGEIPTGGSTSCVDATGTGVSVSACDDMNITPPPQGQSMLCGQNYDQPPPGYLVCQLGFGIYTAGQAEDLAACLAQIGVEDACTEELVVACVDQTYNDACTQQDVIDYCDGIATTCEPDPFDAGQCASDLNPFGQAGLSEINDCINNADPNLTCQEAYDLCFQTVASA